MLSSAYFRRLGVFGASPAVKNHTVLQLLFIDYAETSERTPPITQLAATRFTDPRRMEG